MKERYDIISEKYKNFLNVEMFMKEIDLICKKYNLSISHEDSHGGFIIEKYNSMNIDWLNGAGCNITTGEE